MSHNAVQLNRAISTPASPVVSYDALPLGGKDGCKLLLIAFSSVKNHTKSRNVRVRQEGYIIERTRERGNKNKTNKQSKQKKKQEKNRINRV